MLGGVPTRPPSRVLFYGVTGSGKSSAAHAYAKASGLPEYSADDDIGWFPGWQQRAVEEQRRLAADIASREEWVLDSAYATWRDMVLPRAELIVALDYPRWVSLSRLLRRSLYRAVNGQLVCNGNTESFRRLLARDSIIWWHFQSFTRKRQVIQAMKADPALPPVIVFKRPRDLSRWLSHVHSASAA
ncbi:Adenylate kinase [Arthrobacter subterraneus]|uniref:Adenylate kinase n=1 Tax=Arthrobacter subterraneus TaxID=335973 RepID=A0A1G8K6U3_9MICC|nr:Adenylate kinase [Arthrobacter subterraneus]